MVEKEFSIVIIPDTQMLSFYNLEIYPKMTQWIRNHANELNLKMILHLGDVVQHGGKNEEEYRVAANAFESIYDADIPMMITPGNHDYDNMVMFDRSLSMFNHYFGEHRFNGKEWFGGTFERGAIENSYATLKIEGDKYIFVSLEFGPRDETLAWADQILETFYDHKAFIITHCYMYIFGEKTKTGDQHNPKTYEGAAGANDGEDQWKKCFRKHSNVVAIFSGHHVPKNVSCRVDQGDCGNRVFQSFQNWQAENKGGEGRIRIITINLLKNEMKLSVFNTSTEVYEKNDGYEVVVPLQGEDPNFKTKGESEC